VGPYRAGVPGNTVVTRWRELGRRARTSIVGGTIALAALLGTVAVVVADGPGRSGAAATDAASAGGPDDPAGAARTTAGTGSTTSPTSPTPTSAPTEPAGTTPSSPEPSTTTTVPADQLPTLTEGDTGDEVLELQLLLIAVTGVDILPDGIYGPATAEAVRKFQRFVGLPETGEADHATRTLLLATGERVAEAEPSWPIPSIGDGGADGCQVAVVGDSLMAGSMPMHAQRLADIGCAPAVDAVPGRSLAFGWQCLVSTGDGDPRWRIVPDPEPDNGTCSPSGLELLRLWSEAGALGDVVVVALGTNDAGLYQPDAWVEHWQEALQLVGDRPIVFVTSQAMLGAGRTTQTRYSEALRQWCARTAQCVLAEWAYTPTALDNASYVDPVHLTLPATQARARFLAEVVAALITGRPAGGAAPLPTVTSTLPRTSTTSATTTAASTSSTTTSTPASATSTSTTTSVPATPPTPSTSSSTSTSTTSSTSTSTTTTPAPGSAPGSSDAASAT
jgi:peptidoglycan hydrolase-like protein with peptidoglycan-binding domain